MTIKHNPTATIYALRDPFTWEVRYVGRTSLPLEDRLAVHCATRSNAPKRLWVDLLRARGARPSIEALETITGDATAHAQAERKWIAHFRPEGRLFNKNTPSNEHAFEGWAS